MADYYLGVDIGNTKSLAVVADADGKCLSMGRAGCGNHEAIGADGFASVLNDIVSQALSQSGVARADIKGAGFGIAGYDWDSDLPLMDATIGTLGLNCPYKVINDCGIGLVAGASEGWGIVVSAGTSCNAAGRDRHGREGRMSGNGMTFGEYGGGWELVYSAVQQISRAWSKRGQETLLTDLFVRHCGATDATDLLEGLARERYRVRATDAPVVFEAVRQGDPVALAALHGIADGLADLAIGIIRQLELENEQFEVVLSASFFNGSPLTAEWMGEVVRRAAPGAQLVRLEAPPVAGAVLLGMEQVFSPSQDVREKARTTSAMLLNGVSSN
jgi:N-acetylglucosamine kinase-like BadF-type ATPase